MSGKKISELQELLALENDDLLLVVDADEANIANKSKSVKISTLKDEVGANVDLSAYLKRDGSNGMTGSLNMNGQRIAGVAVPINDDDATTKGQLNSRISPIEGIFEFQHTVAYQNNAGIYANGQPGVEDALLRSGWYYENLVSGEKVNWYFFDGNPLSPTFMADIEVQNFAAYAVVTFDSIASRPFLSVYTLPTGTNDIIPGFAHSSFAYSQYPITPDIGRKYLIHIGEAPAIHPELPRIQIGLSVGLGDQAPTEKVLTAALSSDSGASVGNVKFVAEHVGVNAPNLKANAELKIAKQNLLVSGTNIKTVNGSTLLGSGNLAIDSAESLITTVFNASGSPIAKMSAVYINGIQGDRPRIVLAQADSEMSSSKTYGLVRADIPNMSDGVIVEQGRLENLDTDVAGWVEGDALWLSPTVAGGITNVKPLAPNHSVFIGYLIRKHPNQGVIQVNIQNGNELQELHNVSIPVTPANGDVLAYELSTSLWKNKALTAADVGAATTSLSNLVTTAIPSGVDIISNDGAAARFEVRTADSLTGSTGEVVLRSGHGTTASGISFLASGKSSTGISGVISISSGSIGSATPDNSSNTSSTGSLSVSSGFIANTSNASRSGSVNVRSGTHSGSGGTGFVTVGSGTHSGTSGNSGQTFILSGTATGAGGSSGVAALASGSVTTSGSTGTSGTVQVNSGTTFNGNSGTVLLVSGAVAGTGSSGDVYVESGSTTSGTSGQSVVNSGNVSGTGSSGNVFLESGSTTSGTSGTAIIRSGPSSAGNSNFAAIASGNAPLGNSGDVILETGTAGGTRGDIVVNAPNLDMQNNNIINVAAFYFGDPNVDGTIRIIPSPDGIFVEQRVLGSWQLRGAVPPFP